MQLKVLLCQASFYVASEKVIIYLIRKNIFKILLYRSTIYAINYCVKQVSVSQVKK